MGEFSLEKYKGHEHLKQRFESLKKNPMLNPASYEALSEEEKSGYAMQHLFMTEQERQEEKDQLRQQLGDFILQLQENQQQWEQDQLRYQQTELSKNKNDKTLAKLKTPDEISALREKRQQKAISEDKRKAFTDKMRHGFYKFVGAFVKMGRYFTDQRQAERATEQDPEYEMPGLLQELQRLEQMRPKEEDLDFEKKMNDFESKYGGYYNRLRQQYEEKERAAQTEAETKVDEAAVLLEKELTEDERAELIAKEKKRILEAATYKMQFGDSVQAHVEGGTKPNAIRYAEDGSQWLMKTNHSCIGMTAPNASIMTVAGYRVQKLVDADTAIEAFESKSKGVGTVSLQRMAEGVLSKNDPEYVDLSRFSRTPEAMTPAELGKIEKLAPQFLREYMTDYLLGNYDTKGENFLFCREGDRLIIHGIDKEASGRKDLVPEAQHMQKEKHFFDQDTVYNQLFRRFADGSMNFDLQEAAQYITRIEGMSTEEYLKIYEPYLEQQKKDHTPEEFEQIKKNVIYRKEFIRVEARRFFGELVKERMAARPDEAEMLRQKYLGGTAGGIFLFDGETAEQLKAEREQIARQKEMDADALQEKVRQADEADEKSYKRRHALYDFGKATIMGLKAIITKIKGSQGEGYEEKRTTTVRLSELKFEEDENTPEEVREVMQQHRALIDRIHREFEEKPERLFREYREERYEEHKKELLEEAKQRLVEKHLEKLRTESMEALLASFKEECHEDYKSEEDLDAAAHASAEKQLKKDARKLAMDEIMESNSEEFQQQIEAEAERLTAEEIQEYGEEKLKEELREAVRKEKEETTVALTMVADREIHLGGTKPMSQYIAYDGSKWLAKQAVTCVGTYKPSGALLTEIGSNIQKLVDEGTAVEAFVGQTKKHGMVSFQRMLQNVVSSRVLDLFKFSRHPELATQEVTRQVEGLMPQILREHITDWLLCNFDTKGENFVLTRAEGQPMVLHGIDKEAAFNKILNPRAQQMSTTYKPHANNTLYNVVFEKFANAEMDFDLRAAAEQVEKITQMDDEKYMAQYESYFSYLTEKATGKTKELQKVEQIKANILARKKGLKQEYIRFFTELIERRCVHLHPTEAAILRERYYGRNGTKFRFS